MRIARDQGTSIGAERKAGGVMFFDVEAVPVISLGMVEHQRRADPFQGRSAPELYTGLPDTGRCQTIPSGAHGQPC